MTRRAEDPRERHATEVGLAVMAAGMILPVAAARTIAQAITGPWWVLLVVGFMYAAAVMSLAERAYRKLAPPVRPARRSPGRAGPSTSPRSTAPRAAARKTTTTRRNNP